MEINILSYRIDSKIIWINLSLFRMIINLNDHDRKFSSKKCKNYHLLKIKVFINQIFRIFFIGGTIYYYLMFFRLIIRFLAADHHEPFKNIYPWITDIFSILYPLNICSIHLLYGRLNFLYYDWNYITWLHANSLLLFYYNYQRLQINTRESENLQSITGIRFL